MLNDNFEHAKLSLGRVCKTLGNFLEAKDMLENFIAENPKEVEGICMYAESLIGLDDIESAEEFLNSLSNEVSGKEEVLKILQPKNKGGL